MSGKQPDLRIKIGNLVFRNPVILASGVLSNTAGIIKRVVSEGNVGGVTFKTITLNPREGYKNPVIAVTKAGLVNAMGLPNPGLNEAVKEIVNVKSFLPSEVPLIVSFASSDPKEAGKITHKLEDAGVDAVEFNLSCPHTRKLGLTVSQDMKLVESIIEHVKTTIKIPLFVKLGLQDNIIEIAKLLEKYDVDCIVAINTIRSVVIDIYARKPVLSNVYGGLSGVAIHPIAVRVIYDLYKNVNIPIIGVGGVEDWIDAIEMMLAGACAVEVGTAVYSKGISIFKEVIDGVSKYLESEGFSSITDIIGLAHTTT